MKPGGVRAKGSGFEREVAKTVIKAFKKFGIKKQHCYRTPMSGGHAMDASHYAGDLVIRRKLWQLFPFSVECKNQKGWEFENFFYAVSKNGRTPVFKWMDQCLKSVEKSHRQVSPLVVVKTNRSPVYCLFLRDSLQEGCLGKFKARVIFKYKNRIWYLCLFSEFLKVCVFESERKRKNV